MREFDVPEVLEVQEVPSDEVKMVPPLPTPVKILFPKVTSLRVSKLVLLLLLLKSQARLVFKNAVSPYRLSSF